jgi:hypothetical protein
MLIGLGAVRRGIADGAQASETVAVHDRSVAIRSQLAGPRQNLSLPP